MVSSLFFGLLTINNCNVSSYGWASVNVILTSGLVFGEESIGHCSVVGVDVVHTRLLKIYLSQFMNGLALKNFNSTYTSLDSSYRCSGTPR